MPFCWLAGSGPRSYAGRVATSLCSNKSAQLHMNTGLEKKIQRKIVIIILPINFNICFGFVCLFVCFVALRPKSTSMVMAGWTVPLTTLFPGQA